MSRSRVLVAAPVFLLVALVAVLGARKASAQPAPPRGPVPYVPPSPFESGMHGFSMGATVGTAIGYLVAREDGFTERDWRPIVAGMGIGALAGGGLGLTLGLFQGNPESAGRGFLVMRGMAHGAQFGFFAGSIAGGLAALESDKLEHVLFGGAVGTLVGASIGLLIGSFERNPWAAPPAPHAPGPMALSFSIAPLRNASGGFSWTPFVSGRF